MYQKASVIISEVGLELDCCLFLPSNVRAVDMSLKSIYGFGLGFLNYLPDVEIGISCQKQ